ncbi:MAG: hypothetical protein JKY80_01380 [Mariprofundaceae bacterium]|nr:hypothetical protein [Mariprofundaceae bacterium]
MLRMNRMCLLFFLLLGITITATYGFSVSLENINVQAGFDGALDETHSKKSGWFTGGALFSKSEDLEGKLTKTAALANLSGNTVSFNANKDIALVGVNANRGQAFII